jgi:acyl carrier protein
MSEKTIEQILGIVQRATKNIKIDENSSMQNTDGWDSLAYLVIVQELEDIFHIKLNPQNINSFGSVREIIKSLNEK